MVNVTTDNHGYMVYIGIYWYILVYIGIDWYRLVYIGIYWYILVYIGIYWYILVYIGIYWYILVYIGIYWYILVYIGIYWYMVLYLLNHVVPMTFRNWDLQMFIHTMCRLVVSIDRMLLGTSGSARFFVGILSRSFEKNYPENQVTSLDTSLISLQCWEHKTQIKYLVGGFEHVNSVPYIGNNNPN